MNLPALSLSLVVFSQTANDTSVWDRFVKEYPGAAARLEDRLLPARGNAFLFKSAGRTQKTSGTFVKFAITRSLRKFEVSIEPGAKAGTQNYTAVYCMAGLRSFRLNAFAGSPYQVRGVGSDPAQMAEFRTVFGKFLEAPWAILGAPLVDFIRNKEFQLDAAKEVDTNRGRLVEINFRFGTFNEKPNSYRVRLDPALNWAIVESEFRLGSTVAPESLEIEYSPASSDGRFFPKRIAALGIDGKRQICEFEQVAFIEALASEFTMEHCNLKDVTQFARKPPSPLFGWFVGTVIVVALLALAILLKRLANMRRRT